MSLDIDMKTIWSSNSTQMVFHRFQVILCIPWKPRKNWSWSFLLTLASGCPSISPRQRTESEQTCTFAFDKLITLLCIKVDLIQGVNCDSIVETCMISCFWNKINQHLRDVEQRFERLEVGVPVGGLVVIIFLQDAFIVVDKISISIHWLSGPAPPGRLLDDCTCVEHSRRLSVSSIGDLEIVVVQPL